MPSVRSLTSAALAAVALAAAPAHAQESYVLRPAVSVSAGVSQFDLSGTGSAPMAALRVDLPLTRAFLLEGGASVARPDQQFGETTTFVIPEVAVQLQLPRRVAPYVGLGAGEALDFRPERVGGLRHNVTLSGAAGVRAWLTDAVGLRGELRVRGIGTGFGGSTAEWTGGAAIRF